MLSKKLRKFLQVGDSKPVTLPPDWLKVLNLNRGDSVDMLCNFDEKGGEDNVDN